MKVNFSGGLGAVACFGIAYFAFTHHQAILGWLFLVVGLLAVLLSGASSGKT
jgi:hypothetical protein